MAWTDRMRQAAYTSQAGTRLAFDFENVTHSIEKKGTAFEFPDADGTYVQEQGRSGRRYPVLAIFSGADHDLQAESFMQLVSDKGIGKLEHPIYGVVDVVPLGEITRRDDLVTEANQSKIQLTFFSTIKLVYPTSQTDKKSQVKAAIGNYNAVASTSFVPDLSKVIDKAIFQNSFIAKFKNTVEKIQDFANLDDEILQEFKAIVQAIEVNIRTLLPADLFAKSLAVVQLPAGTQGSTLDKIVTYESLIDAQESSNYNDFVARDFFNMASVTGSAVAASENTFVTRSQAIKTAEDLLNQLDSAVSWREAEMLTLEEIDTGSAYQALQELIALTAGYLVEISFTLKQERAIVLDRARTCIDLCAELYGTVDKDLDYLISSNNFTGDEILELPRGKKVLYYV